MAYNFHNYPMKCSQHQEKAENTRMKGSDLLSYTFSKGGNIYNKNNKMPGNDIADGGVGSLLDLHLNSGARHQVHAHVQL